MQTKHSTEESDSPTWQDLAQAVTQKQEPDKLTSLVDQLDDALRQEESERKFRSRAVFNYRAPLLTMFSAAIMNATITARATTYSALSWPSSSLINVEIKQNIEHLPGKRRFRR
jgi:hypothetical protein